MFDAAGIPPEREGDWAMTAGIDDLIDALARHRNWERAIDPPPV